MSTDDAMVSRTHTYSWAMIISARIQVDSCDSDDDEVHGTPFGAGQLYQQPPLYRWLPI